MPKGRALLLVALVIVGVIELVGVILARDTISALTRDVFHVHTPQGRAAFTAAWVSFSVWFLLHVNN